MGDLPNYCTETSMLPCFPWNRETHPDFNVWKVLKGISHNIVTTCRPKTGVPENGQKVSSVSGTELCQMPRLSPSQDSWKIFQGKWKQQMVSHVKSKQEVQRKERTWEDDFVTMFRVLLYKEMEWDGIVQNFGRNSNPQTFIVFQETESETSHRIHGMLATIAANVAKRTSDLGVREAFPSKKGNPVNQVNSGSDNITQARFEHGKIWQKWRVHPTFISRLI